MNDQNTGETDTADAGGETLSANLSEPTSSENENPAPEEDTETENSTAGTEAGADDETAPINGATDLAAGDLSAGDLAAGDLSAGDLSAGDLPAGDLAAGDLSAGDLSAGDLAAGTPATADTAPVPSQSEDKQPLDAVPVQIDFELGQITLPVSELRNIGPGYTFTGLPETSLSHVLAKSAGRAFAEGELVDIGGRIGFRITKLFS